MTPALAPLVDCAPETLDALRELFERELCHHRLFVLGRFQFAYRQRCVLRVHHPQGGTFEVVAEAVYVRCDEPGRGVGLDLVGLDRSTLDALARFVMAPPPGSEDAATRSDILEPMQAPPQSTDTDSSCHGPAQECEHSTALDSASVSTGLSLYDRTRKLTLRQRDTVARSGSLAERVALERTFGSSVWEALLQNPQISLPEIARIAKNGTLPIPLVSILVANAVWLQSGEIRRALLGNPRVSGAHLERVLRAVPRAELKQIVQASPYRNQVRMAAKKLFGE